MRTTYVQHHEPVKATEYGSGCAACHEEIRKGDWLTSVALGPGPNPEERERARAGKEFATVVALVHWACATGFDRPGLSQPEMARRYAILHDEIERLVAFTAKSGAEKEAEAAQGRMTVEQYASYCRKKIHGLAEQLGVDEDDIRAFVEQTGGTW